MFSFFAKWGSKGGGPGVKEDSLGLLEIPLVRLSYVRLGGRKLNLVYFSLTLKDLITRKTSNEDFLGSFVLRVGSAPLASRRPTVPTLEARCRGVSPKKEVLALNNVPKKSDQRLIRPQTN